MKPKKLLVLGAIFIALVLFLSIKKQFQKSQNIFRFREDIVAHDIGLEEIDECTISYGEKRIQLVNKDGRWIVNSHFGVLADMQKFARWINSLDGLSGEMRSDDAALLPDYGISDAEGIDVVLKKTDNVLAHLVLGTRQSGRGGNFVRAFNSDKVYAVDENLLAAIGLWRDPTPDNFKAEYFSDLRVFPVSPEEIAEVTLMVDHVKTIHVVRSTVDGQGIWNTSQPYPYERDPKKITRFINKLASLRADDVVQLEDAEGLDSDAWELTVSNGENFMVILRRGSLDENASRYYAAFSQLPYAYLIPKASLDALDVTDAGFYVDNPMGINELDIEEITLADKVHNKEFSLIRDASADALPTITVWRDADGELIDTKKTNEFFNQLKALPLKSRPFKKDLEPALIFRIVKTEGAFELTISKEFSADDGSLSHVVYISDHGHFYLISKDAFNQLQLSINGFFDVQSPGEKS